VNFKLSGKQQATSEMFFRFFLA